jgi:hypothetical protein
MRMRSAAQAAGRSSSSASAFASTSTAGMVQETTGMDVPVGAGGAGDPGWLDGILGRGGRSNGTSTRIFEAVLVDEGQRRVLHPPQGVWPSSSHVSSRSCPRSGPRPRYP